MFVVRCHLRYRRAHDNAGMRIGGQLHVVTEAIVLADTLLHDARLRIGDTGTGLLFARFLVGGTLRVLDPFKLAQRQF